jgi:hypothetical protein
VPIGLALLVIATLLAPQARAGFDLGVAANYGVLVEPGAHNYNLNNSTIFGNVGIGNGVNAVMIASNGFVQPAPLVPGSGRMLLAGGTPPGGISNPGNVSGGVFLNQSGVTDALNVVNALTSALAGEAGTALTISGAGQTILASSGTLDASGNRVFTVAANGFNNNSQGFTVVGSASDFVVFNINNGTSNESLGGPISLSGGITPDHVLFNFTGTSGNLSSGSTNGATVNGVFLAQNMLINLDNVNIVGFLFGGRTGTDFSTVSGFSLMMVPEPASVLLLALGGIGVLSVHRLRSRKRAA